METTTKYNPFASDAINRKVKILPSHHYEMVKNLPNFHKSGSIKEMKKRYYGKGALLVKCGDYIYNVSSDPEIYYRYSY